MLWGVAALTNTSLLAFLPASGLWAWYRRWKRGKSSLAGVVLSALVFVACIAPWLARNQRTLGVLSLRSNFGAELRIGNGPGADGTWREYLHPTQNVYEMRLYRQMGEVAYVAERKREAIAFIREDYRRFLGLCLKRFIYYWGGVPRLSEIPALAPIKNSVFLASSVLAFWGLGRALRKRKPGAWLFLWLILFYPVVYYAVFPHPRYRHPIEPELGILIVYVISEAREKAQRPERRINRQLNEQPAKPLHMRRLRSLPATPPRRRSMARSICGSSNDERRLEADDVAVDPTHTDQHALAQQTIANGVRFRSGRRKFVVFDQFDADHQSQAANFADQRIVFLNSRSLAMA